MRERPELAFRYGDPRTVARLYAQEEPWHGSVHFRTAALYARDPEQHDRADEQLRMAWAWVRRRETLPENETHNWRLDAEDAASSVIATFYLNGPEEAKKLLKRWRPRGFVFKVLPHVATALAPRIDLAELEDQTTARPRASLGGSGVYNRALEGRLDTDSSPRSTRRFALGAVLTAKQGATRRGVARLGTSVLRACRPERRRALERRVSRWYPSARLCLISSLAPAWSRGITTCPSARCA